MSKHTNKAEEIIQNQLSNWMLIGLVFKSLENKINYWLKVGSTSSVAD